LTISRATPTPDSAFSLEPDEFAAMVSAVRVASAAIGRVSYGRTAVEEASAVFRRSLFVVRDVAVGDVLTGADVQAKRPGIGLHPRWLPMVTGRRVTRAVPAGTPVSWDLVEGGAPSSGQGEAAAEQDEHEG
ncbi:MAG: SAF domain-containing protein, partial [Vicinamibacterales bacterium]